MKTISYTPWIWRQKTWRTRVFATPLKPCTGRYCSRKSSREPENVSYSPWNGQKIWKMWHIAHGNGSRKHEKHEFLRRLSNHVSVCTVAENPPGNPKMCTISHEMGKKHENCGIARENGGSKHEKHEFFLHLSNHVPVVTVPGIGACGSWKSPWELEINVIAHEMGRKTW
jgi:hypothetical protein